MFGGISIVNEDFDTKYTFDEWGEVDGYLQITCLTSKDETTWDVETTFNTMSKADWEEFKLAGDTAFKMMKS